MKNFPTSLVQAAEEQIIHLLIEGKLALGQRLTESNLASQFGMSTMPIHEALQKLNHAGLVRIVARQGTFVFTFGKDDIYNLNCVRAVLECEALKEAVMRNYDRLCPQLAYNNSASLAIRAQQSIANYLPVDQAFHRLLFTYAENPFLQSAYKAIEVKTQILWHMTMDNDYSLDDMYASMDEHVAISQWINERQVDKACDMLAQHISRVAGAPKA